MIVNYEIVYSGRKRILCVSFVEKNGELNMIQVPVPDSEMFKWMMDGAESSPDPNYVSWDWNPVRKEPVKRLSNERMHEIVFDMTKAYPEDMKILYELNKPRTCFTDIEVDVTDDGFPDAANAANPVNTISWVDGTNVTVLGRAPLTQGDIDWIQKMINSHCESFDEKYTFYYVYYDNEYDLIADYMENYVSKSPCTCGWNYFGYDWPYLYNRSSNIGLDISPVSPTGNFYTHKPFFGKGKESMILLPYHRMMYDYMEVYAKWDRSVDVKESNKLDWVSGKVLGTKKVVHDLGFKEEWEQKPAEYVFYNAVDSILIREIDKKIRTSNVFFGLANLTKVPYLTAFSPVNSLQLVQTEYLKRENRVVPFDSHKNPNNDGYEGAFVYEPDPGIYKNVFATDFRSLYPSIEMQFNISPDTFICKDKSRPHSPDEIRTVSGAVYKRNVRGFIPTITEDFFNQRRTYKKRMLVAENEKHYLEDIYEKRFGKK